MKISDPKQFVFRYRWLMFAILVAAYFFVYFHRMTVNAVGTEMIADIGSGSKEYLSSVYFWTYAFMQIPSGIMADRFGPRRTVSVFLTLAAAGSFATAAGDSFLTLAAGKMLIAAGMAVVYVPLMKIVSVWFRKESFPQLNGIVIAVGNVGALAAAAPLACLADAIGWRDVFVLLGLITVILAALCLTFIRDHPNDLGLPGIEEFRKDATREDRSGGRKAPFAALRTVAGSGRVFWTMGAAYFLVYGTIMVFQGTTSIAYFKTHVYGFSLAAWFVTAIGVGKIVSTLAIGRLTSRGIIRSKKNAMMCGTAAYLVIWVVIWRFAGELDDERVWFTVCTLFGFFAGFMTLSFSQVKEWFPISIAGTAVSMMNVLLFLGASVGTAAAGIILHTEYTLENYSTLWMVMTAAAFAALVMVALSREKKDGDPVFDAGEDG